MTTTPFAKGKRAYGICDRCGQAFRLTSLVQEFEKRRPTGLLVCKSCNDEDHPQLYLGEVSPNDPQSLRNPRPILGLDRERGFYGWNPVGSGEDLIIETTVGIVR